MRRLARVLVGVLTLAGCGLAADENSGIGQSLAQMRGVEYAPRFAALLQSGVPSLQVGFIDREASGALLLERRIGGLEYWLSPEGAQIILQDGMVHGTRGLGEGLVAAELSAPLALVRGMHAGQSDRFHTYLDGNDRTVTRTYRCVVAPGALAPVALAGGEVQTRLVLEHCRSLDQEFTNVYWVLPSAREIVQSRQWVGPFIGAISTRAVR
ncbi:MAG: YjbF family lipoprotein [Sulfitobacter sp.]